MSRQTKSFITHDNKRKIETMRYSNVVCLLFSFIIRFTNISSLKSCNMVMSAEMHHPIIQTFFVHYEHDKDTQIRSMARCVYFCTFMVDTVEVHLMEYI